MTSKWQAKSITPVDDERTCTLNKKLKKIAFDELGETEELKRDGIEAIRDWIMNNPRIVKCRMDSKFILRFLRFRKFNISKAKESLERYLVFHEGVYGMDWFSNLDFNKPNINGLIDNGMAVIFPKRDELGRKVILIHLAAADPSIKTIGSEALTLGTMMMETLLEDEENHIRGFNYIIDVSDIKLRHYFIFSFSDWFKMLKNIEKTCAARHKEFHVVNVNPALKYIAKIVLKHMPQKLRDRVRFYSSFDELEIMDQAELPVKCGGSSSVADIMNPWKKTLSSQMNFLNYNNMKVDRSLYPESVLNCDVHTLNKFLAELD